VPGYQVLDRTLSATDGGRLPAEPPLRPRNRKVQRIFALVVLLATAAALVWAKPWIPLLSVFSGGNAADRTVVLSGRIEGDDSAVAS